MVDTPTDREAEAAADDILASLKLDWTDLAGDVTEIIEADAIEAARTTLGRLGITSANDPDLFQRVSEHVKTYARERGADLVGMKWQDGELIVNPNAEYAITDSTRDMLRGTVEQSITEGWATQKLQSEIIDNYAFSPQRALSIARTETSFARNRGGLVAAKASGVVSAKKWDTGGEPCVICEANEAQGEVPIDEGFDSGDEAPPAHPSCRCSLEYVLSDDAEPGGETEEDGNEQE